MRDCLNTLVVQGDRASLEPLEGMIHRGVRENRIQGEGKRGSGNVKAKSAKCVLIEPSACREWESRIPGNLLVRFGKGGMETCKRTEYGKEECCFNRLAALLENGVTRHFLFHN